MLEKVNQLAEQAATNVSRRQFLRRLGRTAAMAATAAGGVLAFSNLASAGRPGSGGTLMCCYKCRCLDRDCTRRVCTAECKTNGQCGRKYDYGVPVASCSECQ